MYLDLEINNFKTMALSLLGVSAHGNWSNNELPLDLLDVNRMEIKDEIPSSG